MPRCRRTHRGQWGGHGLRATLQLTTVSTVLDGWIKFLIAAAPILLPVPQSLEYLLPSPLKNVCLLLLWTTPHFLQVL